VIANLPTPIQGARCFCGRLHAPYDCIAMFDCNHPTYQPDLWDKAVENVDNANGHTIDFAANPEAHQTMYEDEYLRLADEAGLAGNRRRRGRR